MAVACKNIVKKTDVTNELRLGGSSNKNVGEAWLG